MDSDTFDKSPIDWPKSGPIYERLAETLGRRIVSRQWEPGTQLPKEHDLAVEYKVSRTTVRSALTALSAQGLIRRVRGKGTFVAKGESRGRWFSTASTILLVQIAQSRTPYLAPKSYYGRIHSGIRHMARKLGLAIKMEWIDGYVQVPLAAYVPPSPREVAGVIVCGALDEQYIGMFGSEGVPVLTVDLWSHDVRVDSVIVDVESEAYLAVDHLAAKRHRSLGFIAVGRKRRGSELAECDPDVWRLLDNLRRLTYRRGVQMRSPWICTALPSQMQPYQAVRNILDLPDAPTAFLCFDDDAAAPTLKAVKDAGLRCPEDISIMSRSPNTGGRNPFTALMADAEGLGELAVKLLVERMQGLRQQTVKVAVPSRLVLGKTTGFAPNTAC